MTGSATDVMLAVLFLALVVGFLLLSFLSQAMGCTFRHGVDYAESVRLARRGLTRDN